MAKVKIVTDGTALGTQIYAEDKPISAVSIDIHLEAGKLTPTARVKAIGWANPHEIDPEIRPLTDPEEHDALIYQDLEFDQVEMSHPDLEGFEQKLLELFECLPERLREKVRTKINGF